MTSAPPCGQPDADPDDWFIGRDGKQYVDDELVDMATLNEAADKIEGFDKDDLDEWEKLHARLEADAKRAALARRRRARQTCHTDCSIRLQCLSVGLDPTLLDYGIFGGYYPEERREIDSLRRARERRRGVDL